METKPDSMLLDKRRAAIIETELKTEAVADSFVGNSDPFSALQNSLATEIVDLSGPGSLVLKPKTKPTDIETARLVSKDTDGFLARIIARPISLTITHHLINTRISANTMSFSALRLVYGAPFFLSSKPEYQVIGGLLFALHSILDGCDGELARLRFSESHLGGLLDYWGDNIVHVAVFACMAIGWSLNAGASWSHWPLIGGCTAVLGTIGSASFVHWRTMMRTNRTNKKAEGPVFTSVASSEPIFPKFWMLARDFIYLVLLLSAFAASGF